MDPFDYLNEFNNDTNTTVEPYEPPLVKIAFSLIICIVGLVGNGIVIFLIVVLQEYKKSVTHWYVLQLALADSLFLLTLPFQVVEDFDGRWKFTEALCKTKETILFLNYYASIIFLVVMSLDRFIAVCHPFRTSLQRLRESTAAIVVTVVTWLIALVVCTPVILFSSVSGIRPSCICSFSFPPEPVDYDSICAFEGLNQINCDNLRSVIENTETCRPEGFLENAIFLTFQNAFANSNETLEYGSYGDYPGASNEEISGNYGPYFSSNSSSSQGEFPIPLDEVSEYSTCSYEGVPKGFTGFLIFNFVGLFIVPFVIMSICYGLIVMRLRETRFRPTTPKTGSEAGGNRRKKSTNQSDKDRTRITIMCVTLVGVFAFCWLPFHLFHMIRIAGYEYLTSSNVCTILPIIGTLLAYLNSAVNPYLYTFLGTNFVRRFRKTSVVVRQSIRQKKSVTSQTGGVRYAKNGSQESSAITGITKNFKSRDSAVVSENRTTESQRGS